MRILMMFCMLLAIAGCSEKLNEEEAQTVVESLLHEIDQENYQELDAFYADSFNAGETPEIRAEKYGKLKKALGAIESLELLESENLANFGEPAQVLLTYRVNRNKINSIEKFVVVKEGGNYKVSSHGIVNE